MSVLEKITGTLERVDTDKRTLMLELVVPQGRSAKEKRFSYLLDMAEDDFIRLIGERVSCVVSDSVVRRLDLDA